VTTRDVIDINIVTAVAPVRCYNEAVCYRTKESQRYGKNNHNNIDCDVGNASVVRDLNKSASYFVHFEVQLVHDSCMTVYC
jgi:hypothetical protein